MVDEDMERLMEVLRDLLDQENVALTEIERRLSWARGTISKLLLGKRELRVRQLLGILGALKIEPLQFFQKVYSPASSPSAAERALSFFDQAGQPSHPLALPRELDAEKLQQMIEEALSRVLARERPT